MEATGRVIHLLGFISGVEYMLGLSQLAKWLTVSNRSTAPFPEKIIAVRREMFSTITSKELLTECEGTILFLT